MAAGIEPVFENIATNSTATVCENQQTERAANTLHSAGANWLLLSSLDIDLQEVVAAWNNIPQNIRQAILVLAQSPARPEE